MVYLRGGSSRFWFTIRTRDGAYVHVSTRVRDRGTAEAIESMFTVLGDKGQRRWDLIDGVLAGRCTAAALYDHFIAGTLDQLRARLDDMDLAPAVTKWGETIAQRHRGESVRKYPRWSEALFPLDEQGSVRPAMRSVVADSVHIKGVLEALPGSNSNRRRHHEVFTAIFAYLAEARLVPAGLMDTVSKAKRVKREQPHIARIEDVLRLVHAMPDARMKALAALAEGGGLELPAIRAMRPIDILNTDERIVFAHGSKNVYRDRQAVIDPEFWPVVLAYVNTANVHPLGLLFTLGEYHTRELFRETCAALRAKNVPIPEGYAPHKCRHTFTIRHLQAGDDPTLIAENLGHADVSTMFRDYAKYRPKATEIRRAARANTEQVAAASAAASGTVSAPVADRAAPSSRSQRGNALRTRQLGGKGKAAQGLPPVDSNHHSRIQSPMSCHWTRGQQTVLTYTTAVIDSSAQAAHQSITCTASMRASVCVSTTGAFTLRSSDAASGAESNTPNTVEPEPDMPALCAPASRNPWMYRAISGCRRLTGDSRSLLGSRGNDVHPLKLP